MRAGCSGLMVLTDNPGHSPWHSSRGGFLPRGTHFQPQSYLFTSELEVTGASNQSLSTWEGMR